MCIGRIPNAHPDGCCRRPAHLSRRYGRRTEKQDLVQMTAILSRCELFSGNNDKIARSKVASFPLL
jgi:hypothetical protein